MNMKNIVTVKYFYSQYRRFTGSHLYLIGGDYRGKVYYFFTKTFNPEWLTSDFASSQNGGYQQLKFRLRAKDWKRLIATGKATYICTCKELIENFPCYNKDGERYYNKGVAFEKWAAKYFCNIEDRKKDSDKFSTGGDIVVNNEQVQVKFGKATFCTLNTIHRLQMEARKG